MKRKFIIGFSIIFYVLAGIGFYKAIAISVNSTRYQDNSNMLMSKDLSPEIGKLKRTFLNKNKETQYINGKYTIERKSDTNIDNTNKFLEQIKVDDQFATRLIHTLQIYSEKRIADAQKQFNFILQSINKKNLNLLRIEKVGEYYTVRLGKFENYETAIKFHKEIKPRLSEAIIMKAYIKNERIVRLYK
jgi:hypothetical protein